MEHPSEKINIEDFLKVELKAGTIIKAEPFEGLQKPAMKLWIDFGEDGVKKSSAQITDLYSPQELTGTQVICVTNFPPRQIRNFMSEVLVTGLYNKKGQVVLTRPEFPVPDGSRLC